MEDSFSDLALPVKSGLSGIEWKGELAYSKRGIFFSCRIIPTVFDDGRRGVTFLLEDITEQKRTEDQAKERDFRLTDLIGNLRGMAFRCRYDPWLTMEYVSDGSYNLTGYEPSSLVGNTIVSFNDLICANDRSAVRDKLQEVIVQNIPFRLSFRICTKDRSEKNVCAQGICISRPVGQPEVLEGFIIRSYRTHTSLLRPCGKAKRNSGHL